MNYVFKLWKKLKNKEYREGYTQAQYSVRIPLQIYCLRKARGWSRGELAKRSGLSVRYISRIEEAGRGPRSLSVLQKLCSAFDVGLHIEFSSFSDIVRHVDKFDMEAFNVVSFSSDVCPEALAVGYDVGYNNMRLSKSKENRVRVYYSEPQPEEDLVDSVLDDGRDGWQVGRSLRILRDIQDGARGICFFDSDVMKIRGENPFYRFYRHAHQEGFGCSEYIDALQKRRDNQWQQISETIVLLKPQSK